MNTNDLCKVIRLGIWLKKLMSADTKKGAFLYLALLTRDWFFQTVNFKTVRFQENHAEIKSAEEKNKQFIF